MYLSNISFEGKTIVITGGTQGIGFAVATQCVELGGKVVLIGRNKEKAEAACEKLGKDRASYYLCDLGSADSVQKVFERIVTENKDAGKEYKDVEHYGVIIKGANQTILVSGDCEICDEKLLDETRNERIGISIMNFPWVTLRKGRAAIESLIKPKHLIVAHLPFEEDDIYGYFPATEKAIKNMDKAADIRVFHRFLQKECFE